MVLSEQQKQIIGFADDDGELMMTYGATRSGKGFANSIGFTLYTQTIDPAAITIDPDAQEVGHLVAGRRTGVMEKELLPGMKLAAQMLAVPFKYWRAERRAEIGAHSYYFVAGTDARSAERVQGMTAHSALVDEVGVLPEDFFEMCMSRLTFDDSKGFCIMNPCHPRLWPKRKWMDAGKFDVTHKLLLDDNPTLGEKAKARLVRSFSGLFKRRMIDAEFAASEGLVYVEFSHGSATEYRRVDLGVDVGNNAAIVALGEVKGEEDRWHIPEGRLLRHEERGLTDDELCEEIVAAAHKHEAQSVVLDPSARSVRERLLRWKGRKFTVRRGDNDVVPGVRHIGAALAHGRLTIDEKGCEDLLDEIGSYQWDDTREDEVVKANDHTLDAMRYVGTDRIRYLPTENIPLPEAF